MVALATKEKAVHFNNLQFNKRWQISYYKESAATKEPSELKPVRGGQENSELPNQARVRTNIIMY